MENEIDPSFMYSTTCGMLEVDEGLPYICLVKVSSIFNRFCGNIRTVVS